MHSLPRNFIQTKEAAKLFGYSTDYLARLARTGEVIGERRGRAWFVDPNSLTNYLRTRADRKMLRAGTLARERAREYRAVRPVTAIPTYFVPFAVSSRATTTTYGYRTYLHEVFVLGVACVVVGSGVLLARTPVIAVSSSHLVAGIQQVSLGLSALTADIPKGLAARLSVGGEEAQVAYRHVAGQIAGATGLVVPPNLVYTRFSLNIPLTTGRRPIEPNEQFARTEDLKTVAVSSTGSLLQGLVSTATSPRALQAALFDIYVTVGQDGYRGISLLLDAYPKLIASAGSNLLHLGATTRDMFALLLGGVIRGDVALGQLVVDTTHRVIDTEVALVYAIATEPPKAMAATIRALDNTHFSSGFASAIKAIGY